MGQNGLRTREPSDVAGRRPNGLGPTLGDQEGSQENEAQQEREKLQRQLTRTKKYLHEEKTKPFWKKLLG